MSMLNIFNVSGSAISAQSQRLNVVASNLANADTVAGPDGQAYKARQVTFQTQLMGEVGAAGVKVTSEQSRCGSVQEWRGALGTALAMPRAHAVNTAASCHGQASDHHQV